MKKKFTVIYDIVCALFIDYQDKPVQKKYLLGYIAMVHKDMGLTLQDFQVRSNSCFRRAKREWIAGYTGCSTQGGSKFKG